MNPHKGEVALTAGDKAYTLRLSINAMVDVETLLDKGINEIITSLDPETVRISTLRALLWGALREHHPQVSIFDAGDLISEIGAAVAGEKIGEALKAAFPAAEPSSGPLN
jgi:hypothetical protein